MSEKTTDDDEKITIQTQSQEEISPDSVTKPPLESHPVATAGCGLMLVGVFGLFASGPLGLITILLGLIAFFAAPKPKHKDSTSDAMQNAPSNSIIFGLTFGSLIVLFVLVGSNRSPSPDVVSSPVAHSNVFTMGGDTIMGATEKALGQANTVERAAALEARGEICLLPSGTEVTVMDRGIVTSEVIVTSGAFTGKKGFLPSEFVR